MANLRKIVYLSEDLKNELFTNGTITSNGTTVTYNENDIYVTPDKSIDRIYMNNTLFSSNNGAIDLGNVLTPANGKANNSIIAPVEETSTASQLYNVGDLFIYNDLLYKTTSTIATSTTITPDTNCESISVISYIEDKADKVSNATNGNFAALDANGNLADSGKKASDFGTYSKPSGGIPSSDMASAVQTSLGKADTAYQKPSGGIPASDIASGVIPDPISIIDDTAGNGDTTKVWSADKVYDQLALKATINDAIFTNSISLGRKNNTTVGVNSLAFGYLVEASGRNSHAYGNQTIASGDNSYAEGYMTKATEVSAHAEGTNTEANGIYSKAEGAYTKANATMTHAEGLYTIADGAYSHVGGKYNIADNVSSWNEWAANTSYNVGDKIKITETEDNVTTITSYICKTANSDSTFTSSHWQDKYIMNYAEIIGNGISTNDRSNARVLDWDGNERLKGYLYVGCNSDSTGGSKVATESFVTTRVPAPPSSDGTYYLKCVVSSGMPTYSWATLPIANGVSF